MALKLPTEQVELRDFLSNTKVYIKRDDQIHPFISGNKFRKLIGNLKFYYSNNFSEIVTVGSAHSNYIHAISFVAFQLKIPMKVFVYGHYGTKATHVLNDLIEWDIHWERIERNEVAHLDKRFINSSTFFIPEGANSNLADFGINQVLNEIDSDFCSTGLLIACGTGASINSVLRLRGQLKVLSISPVKTMKEFINNERLIWLNESLTIPFAGYSDELIEFIEWFYKCYNILLDPIYTSRLLFEFQINNSKLLDFEKIVFIHSGGIQAWRDYRDRYPKVENRLGDILNVELQKFNP